jgi:hypothetical protein
MELKRIEAGEEERAIAFLRSVFHPTPSQSAFLEPRHVRWKFFEAGPEWEGSRSFVLEDEGTIASHGCICPITVRTPDGPVRAIHVIDWGASPAFPGAGNLLLYELRKLADAGIGIGGSAITRAMGRKASRTLQQDYCTLRYFVRPLRPVAAFAAEERKTWKSPLRLARNLALSAAPLAATNGWTMEQVDRFPAAAVQCLDAFQPRSFSLCLRPIEFLDYMLRCPAAKFSGYTIRHHNVVRGYALLSQIGGQARIADLSIDSEDPAAWAAAYALAYREAARSGAVQLVAAASAGPALAAIRANGFRPERDVSVVVVDPRKLLTVHPVAHLGMIDGDASYLG